jgi:hypothetical protein
MSDLCTVTISDVFRSALFNLLNYSCRRPKMLMNSLDAMKAVLHLHGKLQLLTPTLRPTLINEHPSHPSRKIFIRRLDINYRVYKCHLLVPIPSQINSVRTSPCNFFNIHFNTVLPTIPRSFQGCLFLTFPYTSYMHSSSPHTCPAHSIFFDLIISILLCKSEIYQVPHYTVSSSLL